MTTNIGPHQHWGGVIDILNSAFTPSQTSESGTGSSLDAIEQAYDELTQTKITGRSQAERQQATHAAVSEIFERYPALTDLELSHEEIKSIRQAAAYLKNTLTREQLATDGKGWFTDKIIEIAESKLLGTSPGDANPAERRKFGQTLEAYANRLEYVFGVFEKELITRMSVEIRGVDKKGWEQGIEEEFQRTLRNNDLLAEIQKNFDEGKIKLSDARGNEIAIPPRPTETPFENYLKDTLLPVLMDQMGIDRNSEEAQAILTELGSRKEETAGLKMMAFMLFLNFRGTPEAEKLKLVLAGMGNQVADRAGEYLGALMGAGDPKKNYFNADLLRREIHVKVTKGGSPSVEAYDTYKPNGFGKDVLVRLETRLTPGNRAATREKANPSFRIHLEGKEVNPDLEKMRNAVSLSGIRHSVWDPDEPMDVGLYQTERTSRTSRPASPEGPQRATLQVLEGKPEPDGATFYVGAIIPPELTQLGLDSLREQIPPGQIKPLPQAHITIIPPSGLIHPSDNIGEWTEGALDVQFDIITLSPKGNLTLMSTEEKKFKETASSIIGDLGISVDPSERRPHAVLASISPDLKDKIFENPEKFGFEPDPDLPGFLRRQLPTPLQLSLRTSREKPLEQELLEIQFKAGGIKFEDAEEVKAKFRQRISRVQVEQEKLLANPAEYEFEGIRTKDKEGNKLDSPEAYRQRPSFTKAQLDLAVKGAPGIGRVPLNFSTRPNGVELWQEFQADIHQLFHEHGIDDVTIQVLGSGVHGYSRNPSKDLKLWNLESDVDLAIFSGQLARECLKKGVAYNKKIVMFGKYTVFKNEVDSNSQGIGFHDTDIGKKISELMERWSIKLFGPSCPPDHVDFKMNIGPMPFSEEGTIDVLAGLGVGD